MSLSSVFFFSFLQGSIKSIWGTCNFYILAKLRFHWGFFFPPLNFYSLLLSLFQNILFKISAGISLFSILHLLQYNTFFFQFTNVKKIFKFSSNWKRTHTRWVPDFYAFWFKFTVILFLKLFIQFTIAFLHKQDGQIHFPFVINKKETLFL